MAPRKHQACPEVKSAPVLLLLLRPASGPPQHSPPRRHPSPLPLHTTASHNPGTNARFVQHQKANDRAHNHPLHAHMQCSRGDRSTFWQRNLLKLARSCNHLVSITTKSALEANAAVSVHFSQPFTGDYLDSATITSCNHSKSHATDSDPGLRNTLPLSSHPLPSPTWVAAGPNTA